MDSFEEEIRAALRPCEPSAEFAARVLEQAGRPQAIHRRRWTAPLTAIAASVVLVAGLAGYRQYEGERARSQVLTAVRIAAVKLNKAQKRVLMLNASHRSI